MSFRIRDDKTGKIIYETDNIVDLMDQLDWYEYEEDRPVKGISARISKYGESKVNGNR